MKKATVHMAYHNGEKMQEFESYSAAKKAANNSLWWPNDFNECKDSAVIRVTDTEKGHLLREIVINQ